MARVDVKKPLFVRIMGNMNDYVVLLRGVNVGGKNKVPMALLRQYLDALGFTGVSTYIASGNVLLSTDKLPAEIQTMIENALTAHFKLDDGPIKVLAVSRDRLQAVVDGRPKGFGDRPDTYHSDAIFLIGLKADDAMPLFDPREGVDKVWPGVEVVYSQRLSAERTKSRLSKVIATPAYKSMTIRSWSTTVKLLELLKAKHTDEAV